VATITVCDDLAFVTFYTDDRNDHLRAVVDDVSGTGGQVTFLVLPVPTVLALIRDETLRFVWYSRLC